MTKSSRRQESFRNVSFTAGLAATTGRRRFFGIVRGLRIRGGARFLLRLAGLLRQVTGRLGVDLLQAARLRMTVAADAFGSAFRRPASG